MEPRPGHSDAFRDGLEPDSGSPAVSRVRRAGTASARVYSLRRRAASTTCRLLPTRPAAVLPVIDPVTSASGAHANRERTCGAKSTDPFIPTSRVKDDSCDEYPFARTYEGGRNGALCADIVPLLERGVRQIYEANPPQARHRARALRPRPRPAAAEQGERVLDTEKYTVTNTK
ncbi:NucA/NucB deoxyribonuclease domain-containing protein [Streptantibioticus cattleyicolor]